MDITRVRRFAKTKRGFRRPEEIEDFVQDTMLRLLSGRKASLDQLYVDWLRVHGKYSRSKQDKERRSPFYEFSILHENLVKTQAPDHIRNIEGEAILQTLGRLERAVLVLHLLWGFNLKEIAYVLGMTESYACYLYKAAKKELTQTQ